MRGLCGGEPTGCLVTRYHSLARTPQQGRIICATDGGNSQTTSNANRLSGGTGNRLPVR